MASQIELRLWHSGEQTLDNCTQTVSTMDNCTQTVSTMDNCTQAVTTVRIRVQEWEYEHVRGMSMRVGALTRPHSASLRLLNLGPFVRESLTSRYACTRLSGSRAVWPPRPLQPPAATQPQHTFHAVTRAHTGSTHTQAQHTFHAATRAHRLNTTHTGSMHP